MRILAAMVLSVTGSVTAFLAVLLALDDPRPAATAPLTAAIEPGRIAGFSSPDLAGADAAVGEARSLPASVARFAAPPVLAETHLSLHAVPAPNLAAPVRAAQVAPIVRRKPVGANENPAAPVTETKPLIADAKAAAARKPAGKPLNVTTRSALGGPRLAVEKSAKPSGPARTPTP